MAMWPLLDGSISHSNWNNIPINSNNGKNVSTDATTAHVKGAWTEFFASTPFDSYLILRLSNNSSSSAVITSSLLDVGIGAAGSELVIFENYVIGSSTARHFTVPVSIPAGERVALRVQSAVVNKIFTFGATLVPLHTGFIPFEAYARSITYGADTATSQGINLTAVASTNTKGAWTEIVASTTNDLRALLLSAQAVASTTLASQEALIDVGVGAAGSEQAIIENLAYDTTTAEVGFARMLLPVPLSIPAGSRLSARYQAASTDTDVRPNVCLYAFS